MTPSLPLRGRRPQGSIPLTPHSISLGFISGENPAILWFFTNLMSGYPIRGEAPAAGVKATVAIAPKSVG
jgi:uncharacterized membrane protein